MGATLARHGALCENHAGQADRDDERRWPPTSWSCALREGDGEWSAFELIANKSTDDAKMWQKAKRHLPLKTY